MPNAEDMSHWDRRLLRRSAEVGPGRVHVDYTRQGGRAHRLVVSFPKRSGLDGYDQQFADAEALAERLTQILETEPRSYTKKRKRRIEKKAWRWRLEDCDLALRCEESPEASVDLGLELTATETVEEMIERDSRPPPDETKCARYVRTRAREDLAPARAELLQASRGDAIQEALAWIDWEERHLDVEPLRMLCPTRPQFGEEETAVDLDVDTIERALSLVPDRRESLVRDLIAYFEYDDTDALERLEAVVERWPSKERYLRVEPRLEAKALRLCSLGEEDPRALVVWLSQLGSLQFIDSATRQIAAKEGIEGLPPPGKERGEVLLLQLLFVAWALGKSTFIMVANKALARPEVHKRCAFAATNFVRWDLDREVRGQRDVVRVRLIGDLVLQWSGRVKGTKPGRLSMKRHPSSARARKDARAKLARAAEKLGAEEGEPTVALRDPFVGDPSWMDYDEPADWPSWWC